MSVMLEGFDEDGEVALAVQRLRFVKNLDVTVKNDWIEAHSLVNWIHPDKGAKTLEQFRAVLFLGIEHGVKLRLGHVLHLHDFNLREKAGLEAEKPVAVFGVQNLVRVCSVDIFHCRLRKGKIPCGGKVVGPVVIVDAVRVFGGDLFGSVCGAGVDDDDLVHEVCDTLQASRKDSFFIFNNHA